MRLKHKVVKNWTTTAGRKFPDRCGENNPSFRLDVKEKISKKLKGRKIWWGYKIAQSRSWWRPTIETRTKMKMAQLRRVAEGRHNNYKGGIEKENDRARKSMEYKVWRDAVFKRDDYTCQSCGAKGCYVEADHVMPFCDFPDLRYEVLNGRTLCKPCHAKITKEQMKLIWRNQYAR